MRRTRFSSWIVFAGVLLLMSGMALPASVVRGWEQANGAQKLDKLTVRTDAAADPGGSAGWSMEEAQQFADAWAPQSVAWSAGRSDTVSYEGATVAGDIVGVGATDGSFAQRTIIDGGPITVQAVEERSKVAVMDADVAERLFRSRHAAGMTIRIGQTPFRVVGVYERPASLLRTMTDDSRPDVLIPISAMLELYPQLTISDIQAAAGSDALVDGEDRIGEAISASGKRPDSFVIDNELLAHRWIGQKAHLPAFAAGLAAIAVMARLLCRQLAAAAKRIRLAARTDDLPDALRRNRKPLLLTAAAGLALAAGMLALWLLIRFRLYIPPDLVPDRWIDPGFYGELLVRHWQAQADGAGIVPTARSLMRERVDGLVDGLVLASLPLGLPLLWIGFKRWRLAGLDGGAMLARVGVHMPAAALLLFAATRLTHLDYAVLPRDIAVLCGLTASLTLYRQSQPNPFNPVKKEW